MVRDARGRFIKGHKNISPGRPKAETYQQAFEAAVSVDDAIDIVLKAKEQAKKGNAEARKFIFAYLIGQPTQNTNLKMSGNVGLVWDWQIPAPDQSAK